MKYYAVKQENDNFVIKSLNEPKLNTYEYNFLIATNESYFDIIPTALAIKELNDSMILDTIYYLKSVINK